MGHIYMQEFTPQDEYRVIEVNAQTFELARVERDDTGEICAVTVLAKDTLSPDLIVRATLDDVDQDLLKLSALDETLLTWL